MLFDLTRRMPGHGHHDLLDRPRDDQRHRLRRQRSRVRDDDDAGKLQRRVDGARQRSRGNRAADHERRGQQPDRAGVLQRQRRDVHFGSPSAGAAPRPASFTVPGPSVTAIAASSGRPAWPSTMTISPALTPDRISTCVPSERPISHRPPLRLRVDGDEHRCVFAFAHDRHRRNEDDAFVQLGVDVHLHRRAGGDVDRLGEGQADRNRRGADLDRGRTRGDRQASLGGVGRRRRQVRRRADLDARAVGERHRRHDLECGCGSTTRNTGSDADGFDEIARVVQPPGDHAVEGRADDRAAGECLRGAERRAAPGPAPPRRRRRREWRPRLPCARRRRARTARAPASAPPSRCRSPPAPARPRPPGAGLRRRRSESRNAPADRRDGRDRPPREASRRCAPPRARRRPGRRRAPA